MLQKANTQRANILRDLRRLKGKALKFLEPRNRYQKSKANVTNPKCHLHLTKWKGSLAKSQLKDEI